MKRRLKNASVKKINKNGKDDYNNSCKKEATPQNFRQ